jgi:hypothetical protein
MTANAITVLNDFGTTLRTTTYTVFVDHPSGGNVETWRTDHLYTASALANHADGLGYRVFTDAWSADGSGYAALWDAMISPDVWQAYGLATLPRVRRPVLACSRCPDVRPDADAVGQGVSLGARCVFYDCDGTYTDPR